MLHRVWYFMVCQCSKLWKKASFGAALGPAAATSAASAVCISYVVIGRRFAPPYKYMVKYIKQKQQQKQQLEGQGRVGDR